MAKLRIAFGDRPPSANIASLAARYAAYAASAAASASSSDANSGAAASVGEGVGTGTGEAAHPARTATTSAPSIARTTRARRLRMRTP
ncbi:hypothetical protein EV379_1895 [Microterricola gilva]|uniref:Uncharacterized protein n=1 Tax=Microterricola gilva TaxID=393267 RepID=A0A4Q8AN54_9MICO|nr:hypothetical protein EV379_1895 [Microterricola gilva]